MEFVKDVLIQKAPIRAKFPSEGRREGPRLRVLSAPPRGLAHPRAPAGEGRALFKTSGERPVRPDAGSGRSGGVCG